jgi:hypothetical protein
MKFFISIILFFSVVVFANEQGATKSDIQMILKVMEANKKVMEANKVDLENQMRAMKSDLENQMKATNRRIDDINIDINNRFSEINGYILALIGGIFATVGFIWWDRRTMISRAKEEIKDELHYRLKQKADHALLDKLLNVLKALAKEDKKIDIALKQQGLSYS